MGSEPLGGDSSPEGASIEGPTQPRARVRGFAIAAGPNKPFLIWGKKKFPSHFHFLSTSFLSPGCWERVGGREDGLHSPPEFSFPDLPEDLKCHRQPGSCLASISRKFNAERLDAMLCLLTHSFSGDKSSRRLWSAPGLRGQSGFP